MTVPGRHTLVMTADVAPDDVEAFRRYEDVALAVMAEHGGVLERRLRSADGTVEVHLVSFADEEAVAVFAADPRRAEARAMLQDRQVQQRVEVLTDG